LNIKPSFSLTKFSIPLSHRISRLYDLVSVQQPHGHNTRSSLHVALVKASSSLTATPRSFRRLSFGTSFLYRSEFLIRITHPPLSDCH